MYKLLIVDDERIVRQGIIKSIDFKALGVSEVFEAENGKAALAIVEENPVDIVLVDINMPKMNGIDFAKNIKLIDKSIKIAFITGYDYFDYALSAIKIGVDDYILKPVSKKDVIEVLNKLIDKKKEEGRSQVLQEVVDGLTKNTSDSKDGADKELIKSIIEENINNKDFTLNMLAAKLGFSVGYLSTLFKKLFGINFREYILDLRLERAKLLILSTSMRNYEIAAAIGIEDPNYFSACFKRRYNLTITEFRACMGNAKWSISEE